ncbi:hypothetical protein ACFOQM_11630 [Paenibacillus sp. GCM10012307]|uniref:Flagellar protein FliT n=1 Tax=Paenibacillus roseus TaxID=2798579 RepID=A0A934IZ70_9BACL|nr:hypothetical protein [Paenibacillus roseus]MBJ6361936.1 hypothetical protein [Paenibacillus roseus]
MDKLIAGLEQLNEEIMPNLNEASYEALSEFVEVRQEIIDEMARMIAETPLNEAQKNRILQIQQTEDSIRMRMFELKNEATDWLRNREQVKIQHKAYENSYAQDSVLMDRKK